MRFVKYSFIKMNSNKGFSLLEILVVIAIMGSVGLMIFTSSGDNKARTIQSDFDNIASYLSLYKNKAMGNSQPFLLQFESAFVSGNLNTTITPYRYTNPVYGNQNECENLAGGDYEEITNEKRFISEATEILHCIQDTGCNEITEFGYCFFTDGSSRLSDNGSALLIQGKHNVDSGSAYLINIHGSTSFFEKLKCNSNAIINLQEPSKLAYCDISKSTNLRTYE
jgi:prepilin-type N-terminal cleavage/methylation domain-containing protein